MECFEIIERLLLKGFRVTVTQHHRGFFVFLNMHEFYTHAPYILSVWKIEGDSPWGYMRFFPREKRQY